MLKAKTITASIFSISLVAFLFLQFVLYKEHALEASWLYFKEAAGVANLDDQRKLGAICNVTGRSRCSVRIFNNILEQDYQNIEAMANLGINYAMLGQYERARSYLKIYFASGGSGFESSKWYAQILEILGSRDEAIDWYYHLVSTHPGFEMASRRLIYLLVEEKRDYEAVTVIDHLVRQYPHYAEKQKRLTLKIIANDDNSRRVAQENTIADRADSVGPSVRIPSFDGRQFRMPQITASGLNFIAVRDDVNKSQVRSEDIARLGLNVVKTGPNRARIARLKFGQVQIENIEVELCDNCETYIGSRQFLDHGARVDTRGRVAFLIMH